VNQSLQQLRRQSHWSYSSINCILNVCSLQWAFRRVYRQEPAFTPVALVFGSVFHQVCEFVARMRMNNRSGRKSEIVDLFSDLLSRECRTTEPAVRFDEGQDVNVLNETGRGMIEVFLDSTDRDERVVDVSRVFCVDLVDADGRVLDKPLIGEFDCVVERDGQTIVVDWKTAARKWPKDKARTDLQPTVYLYAHTRAGGRSDTTFRFDTVTKTSKPVVEQHMTTRTEDEFFRFIEIVKVIDKMVRGELFLPNDQGWCCKGCQYALACESWHRERNRLYSFKLAA